MNVLLSTIRERMDTLTRERDEARRDASALEAALTLETALVHELRVELEKRGGDMALFEQCVIRSKK